MDNKQIKMIKEIDWFLYLTRPLDIFSFVCNDLAYKKNKFAGGVCNVGYLYHNKLVEYYRSRKEFSKSIQLLKGDILKRPEKIKEKLLTGVEYNNKAKLLLTEFRKKKYIKTGIAEARETINFYIDLFAYSTVFPYFIGLAIENTKHKNKEILNIEKIVNRLRLESYYPDFKSVVLTKIFSKIIKDKNIEKFKSISLFDYTPEEIILFLKTNKIKQEKRDVFYFFLLKEIKIMGANKKIFNELKKYIKPKFNIQATELKGMTAQRGTARGYAKIVFNSKDFKKFNKGDILITINSNPSLMPVIKKCKAIISDEGGLCCHAAIISRELRKPCIVGTKIATKVLKDGDLVEVDADKGVVKILEKAK